MNIISTEIQIANFLKEAEEIRIKKPQQSICLAEEALSLSKSINSETNIAKCLSKLSFYLMIIGEYKKSFPLVNDAILLFDKLKDQANVAEAKYTLASIYYKTDNVQLGLKYLVECIAIFKQQENDLYLAKASKSLGTIYEYFGDEENALLAYNVTIEAAKKIGDLNMRTNAYNPLSGIYLNQGNITEATRLIEKSITLKTKTGDIRGLAFAYYGRGKIYMESKEYDLAEIDFNTSLEIHEKMGEKFGLGLCYQKMGVLFELQKKNENAKEMYLKAFHISEEHNIRMIRTKSCLSLYHLLKRINYTNEATYFLEQYHEDLEAHVQDHTYQIVSSYNMIHIMQAKALDDKVNLERLEMIEKNNRAETAVKIRQDFLSNMSHEIRTPLNAVITIPKLLQERANPEEQQLLDALNFSANNLMLLINDVLDFSKLEAGKMVLEPRATNLDLLLKNIINTYDNMAKEKGLVLELQMDDLSGFSIELDELKITQILSNLIGNAIKFTDNGKVELCVKKTKELDNKINLSFSVIDTGIGIPDDFLSEIFNSFSQPKLILSKKHVGTGLGLAIVKKLIELYDSKIDIQTKINKGTTFTFELALNKSVTINQNIITLKKEQLKDLKVLLAEDNKINALVANKLLSRWGVVPVWAKDGNEAVEKSKTKKYDVIFMDIHMPEMNGYDATKIIREEGNLNSTTTIYALTADIVANIQPLYEEIFNGFLKKPIDIDQLYKSLSIVFD